MPSDEKHDERQADDQAERHQRDRRLLAGRHLPLARPTLEYDGADDADVEARCQPSRNPADQAAPARTGRGC